MSRPTNPELKLAPEAWAALSLPERASISRILHEIRRRYAVARACKPGSLAQMDAQEHADLVADGLIAAVMAARGEP